MTNTQLDHTVFVKNIVFNRLCDIAATFDYDPIKALYRKLAKRLKRTRT